MNDDDGDGASDYKATLTYHSYSELVLYPWGHCTGCQTVDHDQLVYHGDQMAEMTDYTNMQSSIFIQQLEISVIGITEYTALTVTPWKLELHSTNTRMILTTSL